MTYFEIDSSFLETALRRKEGKYQRICHQQLQQISTSLLDHSLCFYVTDKKTRKEYILFNVAWVFIAFYCRDINKQELSLIICQ